MKENLDAYSAAYSKDFAYAFDNDLILNWYPKRIVERKNGDSLLELGIGHGFTTALFSKHFKRHVVIDGSPKIVEDFKKSFPKVSADIVVEYFENFKTQEIFDSIVMGFVLEHVSNPEEILRSYKKFLKPEGSLFLTVPNAEALNKRLGFEAGMIKDLFALGDGDKALGHKNLFSVETLRKLIDKCGYRERHLEGLFLKPLTTQQILSLELDPKIHEAMLKVGVKYPELSVGLLMEVSPK